MPSAMIAVLRRVCYFCMFINVSDGDSTCKAELKIRQRYFEILIGQNFEVLAEQLYGLQILHPHLHPPTYSYRSSLPIATQKDAS